MSDMPFGPPPPVPQRSLARAVAWRLWRISLWTFFALCLIGTAMVVAWPIWVVMAVKGAMMAQ